MGSQRGLRNVKPEMNSDGSRRPGVLQTACFGDRNTIPATHQSLSSGLCDLRSKTITQVGVVVHEVTDFMVIHVVPLPTSCKTFDRLIYNSIGSSSNRLLSVTRVRWLVVFRRIYETAQKQNGSRGCIADQKQEGVIGSEDWQIGSLHSQRHHHNGRGGRFGSLFVNPHFRLMDAL